MSVTIEDLSARLLNLYTIGFTLIALTGLCMMEAGYSRKVHYTGVLIKNVYQLSLGILIWWLIGYGFALGNQVVGGFIGKWQFAGDAWQDTDRYLDAAMYGFFGMIIVFSVNIPLVERVQLPIQMVYTGLIMGFIYPVIVAWGWNGGWIQDAVDGANFNDAGGCAVIHLLAGAFALPAIFIAGRREGYTTGEAFRGNSYPMATAGLFLFAIGQFMITIHGTTDLLHVGMGLWNSWLAGGSCALTVTIIGTIFIKDFAWHSTVVMQGFIAGVIAVSATATTTEGWDAFCIGWFVGLFVAAVIRLERWLKVDDMAYNIAWQFVSGFIGTILYGFFNQTNGVFHWGDGMLLGVQVLGVAVIMAWGFFFSAIFFGITRVVGFLRLPKEIQEEGLINAQVNWRYVKGKPAAS